MRWDVIVIGSGFGGSVAACRLAERGARVLVLERGRRWHPAEYPRARDDPWIWDQRKPERYNGWVDLRVFGRMTVAQGAGVGGGSLIYANVCVDAAPEVFARGWPAEITADELAPHYARVAEMLGARPVPAGQRTARFRLLQEAAQAAGVHERVRELPLAVTFDPEWRYDLDEPFHGRHSRPWRNAHGQVQGTCVHCGQCDIGCQVRAKNTLDLNYLAVAERHGAEIRPLHLAVALEPDDGGWCVHFDRLEGGRRVRGSERARRVVLAAGSIGTTELLLRGRDEHHTLPALPPFLGRNWSSNADFLTPARYRGRAVSPTHGPTITGAIDFRDGADGAPQFFIEDGGLPNLLAAFGDPRGPHGRRTTIMAGALRAVAAPGAPKPLSLRHSVALARVNPQLTPLTRAVGRFIGSGDPMSGTMPWFAQGVDAGDGRLYLGRRWLAPWRRTLKMRWDIAQSRPVIEAIVAMHRRLTEATGGELAVPPSWTWLHALITPHPLGGCNIGTSRADGVVSHTGEVFGHPGLFVLDGAIVPRPVGCNPSKTIAALAERASELMHV